VETRRGDVAAAVNWIAARSEVDNRRIALLGWSNGASTTLAAVNRARAGSATPLAAAVVLYPGCRDFLRQPFSLGEPLLMLLGADDDWTPPASCLALADRIRARQPGADLTVRTYEGSVHGFDGARPVRFWKDIPNGKDAAGVHVGGNPQARASALAEIDAFLKRTLGN
ncbi:MAG: dienelactone hydrolase family protein, partial [Burkholderiaceae bacterium]